MWKVPESGDDYIFAHGRSHGYRLLLRVMIGVRKRPGSCFDLQNIKLRSRSIRCIKLTIPYSFNQIPPFIFRNSHVPCVKCMGLVYFIHWIEISVFN